MDGSLPTTRRGSSTVPKWTLNPLLPPPVLAGLLGALCATWAGKDGAARSLRPGWEVKTQHELILAPEETGRIGSACLLDQVSARKRPREKLLRLSGSGGALGGGAACPAGVALLLFVRPLRALTGSLHLQPGRPWLFGLDRTPARARGSASAGSSRLALAPFSGGVFVRRAKTGDRTR